MNSIPPKGSKSQLPLFEWACRKQSLRTLSRRWRTDRNLTVIALEVLRFEPPSHHFSETA